MGFGSNAAGLSAPLKQPANPTRANGKPLGDFLARLHTFVARLYHPLAQILRVCLHTLYIGTATSNLEPL